MNRTPAVQTPSQRKATIWFVIGLGLLLLAAANGHLVYVAMSSQPGCVDHLRQGDPGGDQNQFRAAKSACSPR
jgi:hypothetical protein